MLFILCFLAACADHASDDSGPELLTVDPACPAEARLVLERLGDPVQVDLCQWDGVGWWCGPAEYTLGRDYLVADCEEGGELRVSWWVGGGE